MKNVLELAEMLKNSNITEVSELANAYIALSVSYEELRHSYVKVCSEKVMIQHEKLFKRLAEMGD